VNDVAISANGQYVVSASWDKTVRVWDVHTGQMLLNLKNHTNDVTSAIFNPDGTRLLSLSWSDVLLWDVKTGQILFNLRGGHSIAFSTDGKRLITGGHKGIRVYDVQTSEEILKAFPD